METELNHQPPATVTGLERSVFNVFPSVLRSPAVCATLFLTQCAFSLIAAYFTFTGPLKIAMMGAMSFGLVILLAFTTLAWAGFWALIGRLARQPARLMMHMNIALFTGMIVTLTTTPVHVLDFAFNLEPYSVGMAGTTLLWMLSWIWTFSGHLHLSTAIDSRKIWVGCISFVVAVALLFMFGYRMVRVHFAMGPSGMSSLFPAAFKMVGGDSTETHVARLDKLQRAVDELARANPSTPSKN